MFVVFVVGFFFWVCVVMRFVFVGMDMLGRCGVSKR